jgi:hypothetical protein
VDSLTELSHQVDEWCNRQAHDMTLLVKKLESEDRCWLVPEFTLFGDQQVRLVRAIFRLSMSGVDKADSICE